MMNDAELSVLSLVAESPRHGYELQALIDERGLREWVTIGFSSLYYVLNKLERQGLLTSHPPDEAHNPAQRVYEISEAGRGVLQTAVSELLSHPRLLGSGFELGLANLNALNPRQVYRVLRYHATDLKQVFETVEKSWARQMEDGHADDHVRALYTHSLAVMRAELDWLTGFIEDWKQRYPGVEREEFHTPRGIPLIDPHTALTQVNSRTARSDPAKMIQRLKRLPRPGEE
jgi:DNA-binding PadR family transcriptional regulator